MVARSTGFEIESELASEAVARRMHVVEIPVEYLPRIAGTESKLRAFRDGWRIIRTILEESLRLRPYRPVLLWLVPCAILTATIHRGFAVAAGLGLIVMWVVVLVDIRARHRQAPEQCSVIESDAGCRRLCNRH